VSKWRFMVITVIALLTAKISPTSTRKGALAESCRKTMSALGSDTRKAKTIPIGARIASGSATARPPLAPEIHSAIWASVTVAPKKARRLTITRRRYVRSVNSFLYIRVVALMERNESRPFPLGCELTSRWVAKISWRGSTVYDRSGGGLVAASAAAPLSAKSCIERTCGAPGLSRQAKQVTSCSGVYRGDGERRRLTRAAPFRCGGRRRRWLPEGDHAQ
jgi:hypothetical protein